MTNTKEAAKELYTRLFEMEEPITWILDKNEKARYCLRDVIDQLDGPNGLIHIHSDLKPVLMAASIVEDYLIDSCKLLEETLKERDAAVDLSRQICNDGKKQK